MILLAIGFGMGIISLLIFLELQLMWIHRKIKPKKKEWFDK